MNQIKLTLLGKNEVGKTSIINQLIDNTFNEDISQTFTAYKSFKKMEFEKSETINLEIWDTVIHYNVINKILNKVAMNDTNIVLLIYDITNKESFDSLNEFYKQVIEVNKKENVFFVVAGNKTDLYEKQEVSKEEGQEYAKSINGLFYETSATDSECIENLFKDVVYNYIKTIIGKEFNDNYYEKYINNKENSRFSIEYDKDNDNDLFKNKKEKKEYNNGDIYEGFFDISRKRKGKGIMKYNNKKIYEENGIMIIKMGKDYYV